MDIKYREDSHLLAWQFWIKQCCWLREFFDECYGEIDFLAILYVLFALEEYFYVIFAVSLCVREWIETLRVFLNIGPYIGLPLREGVDWNILLQSKTAYAIMSPSAWGSGLKRTRKTCSSFRSGVSLCVREWIETTENCAEGIKYSSLPLREGVDWNLDRKSVV